jgi:hypothetical protein
MIFDEKQAKSLWPERAAEGTTAVRRYADSHTDQNDRSDTQP